MFSTRTRATDLDLSEFTECAGLHEESNKTGEGRLNSINTEGKKQRGEGLKEVHIQVINTRVMLLLIITSYLG